MGSTIRVTMGSEKRLGCGGGFLGGAAFYAEALGLLLVVTLYGCSQRVRVPVSPADVPRAGQAKAAAVTLWIDPSLTQQVYETEFPYATVGKVHVWVPYGSPLRETIRRAAQASFANVLEGESCVAPSSLLLRVDWATSPTLALEWDSGFQESARGHVELPLRVTVSDCSGRTLLRRNVVGTYAGGGAPAGAWNVPGSDDFAPIVQAALQDTAAKLAALFASIPVPAEPVAQK